MYYYAIACWNHYRFVGWSIDETRNMLAALGCRARDIDHCATVYA